jgi:alkylation response protein AidB-like acyl-CoA dehydrogenase
MDLGLASSERAFSMDASSADSGAGVGGSASPVPPARIPVAALAPEPFAGSEAHRRFRERIGVLVSGYVLPNLPRWEREESLPREFFRTCGRAGMLGLMAAPEHGGSGLGYSYAVAQVEELMRHRAASPAVSLMVQSNTLCPALATFGSDEVKREVLAPLASGEAIGSLGATEPTGGSALPQTVRCTAEREGGEWVVTGEKMYITNAPVADWVLLLARTSAGAGPFTMSLIAVPTDLPGFEVVAQHRKMGLGASPTGHIRLDRVRVPARFLVGRAGHGYPHTAHVLCHERLLIAIGSLAYARSLVDDAAERLRGTGDAGRPARLAVARMRARLEAARAFAYAAAGDVCAGVTDAGTTSMAKFALCELAQRVAAECARLRGPGAAWSDGGMEAALREVRVLSVFAGTSETMRELYGSRLATLMKRATLQAED